MKQFLKHLFTGGLAVFATAGVSQADFIIDNFDDTQGPVTHFYMGLTNSTVDYDVVAAGAVGGFRDISASATTMWTEAIAEVDNNGEGALEISQGSGEGIIDIIWDGNGNGSTPGPGLGGLDITEAGHNDRFTWKHISQDANTATVSITVTDTGGDTDKRSKNLTGPISADMKLDTFVDQFILFSEFNTNIDFDQLDSIVMSWDVDMTDLQIDDFMASSVMASPAPAVVPEPSTFALLGLGFGALALKGRRKKEKKSVA